MKYRFYVLFCSFIYFSYINTLLFYLSTDYFLIVGFFPVFEKVDSDFFFFVAYSNSHRVF